MEERHIHPRPVSAQLEADLGVIGGARAQVQIQAAAVRTVGQLLCGRCFKSLANGGVDADGRCPLVAQPECRRGFVVADRTAVVLTVGQVLVVGIEVDLAVARAGSQAPARCQLPGADQVGFAAFHPVELVTLQTALAAELVYKALAAFALIIPAKARGQGDR